MEIKLNETQVLLDAWNMYTHNYMKGWKYSTVYKIVRTEAHNEAIRQLWSAKAEAKREAEMEAENAKFEACGMDLHTYTMTNFYNSYGYKGD